MKTEKFLCCGCDYGCYCEFKGNKPLLTEKDLQFLRDSGYSCVLQNSQKDLPINLIFDTEYPFSTNLKGESFLCV